MSAYAISAWRRVLSPTGNTGDAVFRVLMLLIALLMVGIVLAMMVALASDSMLSIRQFGFGFLTSQQWDPVQRRVWCAAVHLRNDRVVADRAFDQCSVLFGDRDLSG